MTYSELLLLITDNDNWSAAEAENVEIPFLIRFRPDLQPFIDTMKYSTKLTLTWDYEPDTDSLLPSDEDMDLMDDVEDSLIESLEADAQTVLAFIFTGKGTKRWVWYSSGIEETGLRLNNALADFSELPIELKSEEEADWNEYLEVVHGLDDSFSEYDDDTE